ncbi:MAG TPA: serine/threonine protein kinase [Pyrinomonadaceae bacterium]|jgi:serine/threonine protein kinase
MSELKLQQCRLDGRYDVRECLGRGSYAEVYVADDVAASDGQPRTVVIKALNTHLQGVPDEDLERTLIENFRNEAMALDRVRHPNIISRLGHGTAIDLAGRTFHYLVVEYLPGGDMQALCRHQPLPLARAIDYIEQVAAGLQHAHEHGVIHRDVKPSNLLLTADHSTVKIADFGVAKIEAAEGAITRVGTDVYAAPEHHPLAHTGPLDPSALERKKQLTPAADVYSLAKTAYMLLTGEAPRRFSQKPISELPSPVSEEPWAAFVVRVLRRATQTNQSERYQTVREFHDELRDALLPHTRLLTPPNGQTRNSTNNTDGSSQPPPAGLKASGADGALPAAPAFELPLRPAATVPGVNASSLHPRIVVPVASPSPPQPSQPAMHVPEPHIVRQAEQLVPPLPHVPPGAYPSDGRNLSRGFQLSGRARRWLVALLLIALFAGMLLATHNYVRGLRNNATPAAPRTTTAATANVNPLEREYLARTDINLRSGPNRNSPKIGEVDRGARVRVLDVDGNWFLVEVLERQRPKLDPAEADQGWADRDYFRLK